MGTHLATIAEHGFIGSKIADIITWEQTDPIGCESLALDPSKERKNI